jgi:hypothetical protein
MSTAIGPANTPAGRREAIEAELEAARLSMRAAVGRWLCASAIEDADALERASDHAELMAGRVAGLLRQLKLEPK